MRNYGAMKPSKLEKVIDELRTGHGDARAREGDQWQDALRVAEGVASKRSPGGRAPVAAEVPSPPGPRRAPRPMLAKPMPKGAELPRSSEWTMEPKIDGWRCVAQVDEKVRLFMGRDSTDHTGEAPHVEEWLEQLPQGTLLDGEVCYRDLRRKSSDVKSGLSSRDDRLVYVVFDVLQWGGEDLMGAPLNRRRERLFTMMYESQSNDTEPVLLIPSVPASWEFHESYVALGGEGTMLKRQGSTYRPGARSNDWLKMKVEDTVDALIVSVEQGKGETNAGLPGSFKVRMKNGIVTSAKIKNDAMVAAVAADRESFIDRVVEIKHNGVLDSGKVRHPVVSQLRDDYSVEEFNKEAVRS